MRKLIAVGCLATLTACAAQPSLVKQTNSGLPEARFVGASAQSVRDKLALACASAGSAVASSDYAVTCTRRDSSGRGTMAQLMLGNACSDTPYEKIEFTTVQTGEDVFVTARGWMEIKKCFGDVQRVEYDRNNHFRNDIQNGLDRAVAAHDASRGQGAGGAAPPTTTSAPAMQPPVTLERDPSKRCDSCSRIGKP